MGSIGWHPIGDPVVRLEDAIKECLLVWGDDPAYADAAYKLRQVERELDVLQASPGHRAARRAAYAKPSGQEAMTHGG